MANYQTHQWLNFLSLTVMVVIGSLLEIQSTFLLVGAAAFIWATFFFGPDLDLSHSVQSRRWGPLRPLLRPYWWFVRHRSFWSHSLLAGTLIRLVYISFVISSGVWAFFFAKATMEYDDDWVRSIADASGESLSLMNFFLEELTVVQPYLVVVLAGIWLSDATHIVVDRFFSRLKRL